MHESVTVRAPARVSVFLRVGEADHVGAHDVATLYQAISLYDEVTATPADRWSIEFYGPVDASRVPRGARNLALRAVRALAATVPGSRPVRLRVLKRIPLGSGLGGASTDAVAALVACNELWAAGRVRTDLYALARGLGIEVPFALSGGTAVWTVDGTTLNPALSTGSFVWVLAFARERLRPPAVLRTLDSHRAAHRGILGRQPRVANIDTAVIQAIRAGDAAHLAAVMHNDLQVAALQMDPTLRALLELGERSGALAGIVVEAGSTVAFLTQNHRSAASVSRELTRAGVATLIAAGPVGGAQRIDQPPTQSLTAPIPIRPRR